MQVQERAAGVSARSSRWACLMYHEVPAEPPFGYFAVPRDRFVAQLNLLDRLQLAARPLEDTGPGQVALTFDNGHLTHYAQVFPLLAERGMRATFFVTTDWVGQRGNVT